ncbi:MAG TPA: DNA translocase FtsK 4TM domain-containing protein, partial [Bacteroidales bacterium]|nr:DNA translocase FtsK 4TM domain-containing protein [Bacteroidales bacterium]
MYNNNNYRNKQKPITYQQTKSAPKKGTRKTTEKGSERSKKKIKSDTFIQLLRSQRMIQVYGVFLILFSLLLLTAIVSSYFHFEMDASHVNSNTQGISNIAGTLGAHLAYYFINYTFGFISIGFPFLFFVYGYYLTFAKQVLPILLTTFTTLISMAWFSTLIGCFTHGKAYEYISGFFGNYIAQILIEYTKVWGTSLILLASFFIILILFYNISPVKTLQVLTNISFPKIKSRMESNNTVSRSNKSSANYPSETDYPFLSEIPPVQPSTNTDLPGLYIENRNQLTKEYDNNVILFNEEEVPLSKSEQPKEASANCVDFEIVNKTPVEENEKTESSDPYNLDEIIDDESDDNQTFTEILEEYDPHLDLSFYQFPKPEFLNEYENKEIDYQQINQELIENKNNIVRTLDNFKIKIKKITATIGPTVTLYEIIPDDGVRISRIKNLEDDIALSLAALGIRIIAPIPGKGTIGIEVPNKNAQIVSMKEIINSEKFQNNKYDLPIGLGKTISNEPFVVDLAKMPHLLMAGATGQGKSVGLNAIITSLLYKKHPSELKFVLIDPKKVEFTLYSILERHYLAKLPDSNEPIITDSKKVIQTLNSLCVEMDSRYELLKLAKTRNIKEYNAKFCTRKLSPAFGHRYLPYIVLIIDEFGDLIMTSGREIETPIARLAQLARAIGIHLIIATQRPSVNIITGIIKANFPSRIAFRVSSKIDSRTILDGNGADQLIGKGDMLLSTGSDLIRLQCAFVDTPEVEKIAQFIEEQQSYPEAFLLPEYIVEEKNKGITEEEDS